MKRRNEILETLKLAAQIQHQTAQDRGEIECTETTPCIFCHAVGEMVPPPPPPPDSWVAAPAVITETLSDGSQVYDVKYTLDGGGEIMFGCNSKQAAEELKDILTSEVIWITVMNRHSPVHSLCCASKHWIDFSGTEKCDCECHERRPKK